MDKSTTIDLSNWRPALVENSDSQVSTDASFSPNETSHHAQLERDKIYDLLRHWMYEEPVPVKQRRSFYTVVGKRCIDIVVSSFVILFVLSWLIPIVALLLYIDSPGPFYFKQKRTGAKGKPFTCLKFRTMVSDKQERPFQQTAKNDPRVTRLGRFLRKTNIDEMLQFINVLFGDMTLVGPRPHAVFHDALHWESPSYRARYLVKPGITGLAQVRGSRGITDQSQMMEHRVRYDHFYINRQTFSLDTKICIETVRLTFQGDSNAW